MQDQKGSSFGLYYMGPGSFKWQFLLRFELQGPERRVSAMQRRNFFGAAFAGLGSAATARPARPPAGRIPTRTLGKTGQKVTMIGMGGARFHMISRRKA